MRPHDRTGLGGVSSTVLRMRALSLCTGVSGVARHWQVLQSYGWLGVQQVLTVGVGMQAPCFIATAAGVFCVLLTLVCGPW
jgi:hypothetical protein